MNIDKALLRKLRSTHLKLQSSLDTVKENIFNSSNTSSVSLDSWSNFSNNFKKSNEWFNGVNKLRGGTATSGVDPIAQANSTLTAFEEEIDGNTVKLNKLINELTQITEERETLKNEVRTMSNDNNTSQAERIRVTKELNEKNGKINELKTQIEKLTTKIEELKQTLEQEKLKLTNMDVSIKTLIERIETIKNKHTAFTNKLTAAGTD